MCVLLIEPIFQAETLLGPQAGYSHVENAGLTE